MIQSIIVYGLFMLLMVYLGVYASNNGTYTSIVQRNLSGTNRIIPLIFVFATVSGIRFDVGVDYLSYLNIYRQLEGTGFFEVDNLEIGFKIITEIFASNHLHFSLYFGFLAALQISFIYFAFRDTRSLLPFLGFVIITGGMYFNLMNEIRQGIAVGIFIYSIRYIAKSKLLSYCTCIMVAFLFHRSSLMLLPLYFILKVDIDYTRNIFIQIVLILSAFILSFIDTWVYLTAIIEYFVSIMGYSESYGGINEKMGVFEKDHNKSLRFYAPFIINIVIILYNRNLKQYFNSKRFNIFYNLYFVGSLLSLLFFNNVLLQRPARYFTNISAIIISYMLLYLWRFRKKDETHLLVFIMIIALHLTILFAYIKSDHHTMFQFFWDN